MIYTSQIKTPVSSAASLSLGEAGVVHGFSCHADIASRMRSLGMIEGTEVKCLYKRRGIAAYLVRGALIGIRDEDAACVILGKKGDVTVEE